MYSRMVTYYNTREVQLFTHYRSSLWSMHVYLVYYRHRQSIRHRQKCMYVYMQYHHEVHEHEIDSSPGGHLGAQAVHSGAPIASLDELRLCEPGTLIGSDYPRDYLPIK